MVSVVKVSIRHADEAALLYRALEGDEQATNQVLQYLASTNPLEHQMMQETLHDLTDSNLVTHLLGCLANHRWNGHRDCEHRVDPDTSERIDQAIIAMLNQDEYAWENSIKESVLSEALQNPDPRLRQAAAFLLGLRGHDEVIPILEETIQDAKMIWALRAIRALDVLDDERCGPGLIKALALGRDVFHLAAVRALGNMGTKAEPAWHQALEHPNRHIRWHAAHGLTEMGDPRGMLLLAEGLFDEDATIRWASVEVLARLGSASIPAILVALSSQKSLGQSRQAVFQALKGAVFHDRANQERLKPLLDSLHMPDSSHEAPRIAGRLLEEWRTCS